MQNRKSHSIFVLLSILISFSCLMQSNGQSRHPVAAENGMVVSSDRIASEVGADIMKKGGNAVDAAVAIAFAMAVTLPGAGNVGGGGFLVYHGADGTVTTIDFREKAPIAATETMFLDKNGNIKNNANHEGLLSVGVPGTVAGMVLAHKRYGSKPWAELIEPSIQLAQIGFPVNRSLFRSMEHFRSKFLEHGSSAKIFLKRDGSLYEFGEIWKQPDLAKTLKRIQRNGRDGFYKGKTAELIVQFMEKNGGLITKRDLERYEAVEREPIRGSYRGYDIFSMPPPSSGGVALIEMLNILEGFNLTEMGHNSALYLHILTEAMRYAFADRARYLGDPDFNPNMPIDRLISKEYSKDLRNGIHMYRASKSSSEDVVQFHESEQTTHFSVVDVQGNAVSLTYTLEAWFGSKIVVEGTGFLLNNEMGDFNPIPGHTDEKGLIGTSPNLIKPQKRMLSSMTPTIVAKHGKPVLVIGTPGGRTIINGVLQVILNIFDFQMNIAEAISAGRIHHEWLPDVTLIEKRATTLDSQRLYEMMGHKIREVNGLHAMMGIFIDHDKQLYFGTSDPRDQDSAEVGF